MNVPVRGAWCVAVVGVFAALRSPRLSAQTEATVNRLAPILAAEDARDYSEPLFSSALLNPDTLVVRTAIRAIGRIGDPRGVPLLLGVFTRRDPGTQYAEAAFALGVIRDSTAVPGLIQWLQRGDSTTSAAVGEGVTALARIGGPAAATFLTQVLTDGSAIPADTGRMGRRIAARDAWRLGRAAPVTTLVALATDPTLTRAIVYDLARLRATEGASLLLASTRSSDAGMRQDAARA